MTNQFKSVYGGTLNIKTEVGSAVLAINDNHFTVKSADLPQIAGKMLAADNRVPLVGKGILGGRVTLKAGYGDEEGRVYAAESDAQAARNLNFALANLAAYNEWHTVTKPAKEKAEKEAKAKAEREKSEEAVRAARLKNGLDLYNKVNGVRYVSWPAFVTHTARELWAKQAEEVNALSRKSNPYTTSIFNSGGIFNAHTISANAINRDYFRI